MKAAQRSLISAVLLVLLACRGAGTDDRLASLILQHADTARQERYLPLIREAVKAGRADPLSLAELEDEISVANTGFQLYGTEITFDLVSRVAKLVPVIDPEVIDARRAEIGLPPIDEYLRHAEDELGTPVDRSALASD